MVEQQQLLKRVGYTVKGAPLAEGMAAFPAMVKQQIGNGATDAEALTYGHQIAERFADAEVTRVVDETADDLTSESKHFKGWVGIVSPTACDRCVASNTGFHPKSVEMYRHGDCNCTKRWVTEGEGAEFDQGKFERFASDWEASNASGSTRTAEMARAAGFTDDEASRMAIIAQGWAIDGMSLDGMALREAALRRGATAADFASHPLRNQFVNSRFATDRLDLADQLLSMSQEAVQQQFGTTGTIRVYRGMSLGQPLEGVPLDGTVVEMQVEQRPLSSWSLSKDEATKFANSSAETFGGASYVLEMDVPITDVAGVAGTGLGNGSHAEIVLFGRAGQVARVSSPL